MEKNKIKNDEDAKEFMNDLFKEMDEYLQGLKEKFDREMSELIADLEKALG